MNLNLSQVKVRMEIFSSGPTDRAFRFRLPSLRSVCMEAAARTPRRTVAADAVVLLRAGRRSRDQARHQRQELNCLHRDPPLHQIAAVGHIPLAFSTTCSPGIPRLACLRRDWGRGARCVGGK